MTSASGGFAPSERQSSSADVGRPALRLPDDGPYQVNLVGSEPRCARRALPTRERRTHVANDAARPLLRHSRRNPLVRLRARVRASFRQMSAPQPLGRRATPRYRHLPALTGGCRYQAGGPCPRRRRRLRRPRPYARECSSCRIRGAAGRCRASRRAPGGAPRAGAARPRTIVRPIHARIAVTTAGLYPCSTARRIGTQASGVEHYARWGVPDGAPTVETRR